jgi:hypothetical protein
MSMTRQWPCGQLPNEWGGSSEKSTIQWSKQYTSWQEPQ